MKILICIAIFDTIENKRSEYTEQTFNSLMNTINHDTTEVVFIDNASCKKTKDFLKSIEHYDGIHIIYNSKNEGTAQAINLGIHQYADKNTYCIKMDNDVTFGRYGWADEMVRCIEREPSIGVLGLKRKDIPNAPDSTEYPTQMKIIGYGQRNLGDKWESYIIEWCDDIIGTCVMINPLLREKIGYLWQPACYAFDDNILCIKSLIAGFRNAFYPSIEIEHIDIKPNPYWEWKRKIAGLYMNKFEEIKNKLLSGEKPIYYSPFDS